jgi:hypothetical protein
MARLNVVPFPVSLPDSADQIHHSLELLREKSPQQNLGAMA